jgi:hypothetical protein
MLVAARRPAVVGSYRHPAWLVAAGTVTALAALGLGVWSAWQAVAG